MTKKKKKAGKQEHENFSKRGKAKIGETTQHLNTEHEALAENTGHNRDIYANACGAYERAEPAS